MILISEKQYKANLHCHSVLSDGKLTPEELKKLYKDNGYSVLSITDHERPHDHSALSDDDFIMLSGYEAYIRPGHECKYDIYAPELHINLFNRDPHNTDLICWNDNCVKYVKDPEERAAMHRYGSCEQREYTPEYINKFIETAKEDGYIVALNHPVWSLEDFSTLFDYKGFFSFEMCNGSTFRNGLFEYNSALYDMFLRRGMKMYTHSADDNHNEAPVSSPAFDSCIGFTMINTKDDVLSYDSVFEALENGTFYSSMGPVIHRLEIKDGKAYIKTSDAARIALFFGGKSVKSAFPETTDGTINYAEFDVPKSCNYIRFTVTDKYGRMADTRGIFREEFEKY